METTDTSILLQFAKFSKGFRVSDFDEFVQENIGVENLEFFGRLAYPNQWQIRLSNSNIREKLIRMGKTRINQRSCWMYPLNQQEIRGFVHWLPNSVTNDQLKEQLKLYGEVMLLESQERTIKGRKVESDPRYYCIMLPYGTTKEALPHFLKINGFICHLAIRGRVPACFHCKEVGHRRTECSRYKSKLMSYCNRYPNTTQPRRKSRGRRHVKVEKDDKNQTVGKEDSTKADTVSLEKNVPVNEDTKPQPLLDSEDQERPTEVNKEITTKSENKLAETVILIEQITKSNINTSTASITETESQGIVEAFQKIQQKTAEELRERLENFANEITRTLTSGNFSTNTTEQIQSTVSKSVDAPIKFEQQTINKELETQIMETYTQKEYFIPIEMSEDSKADPNIKENKGEIISSLSKMHEVKQDIKENQEKVNRKTEEAKEDKPSGFSEILESVTSILKQTKQNASKKIQSSFEKLGEEIKFIMQTELPSILSSFDAQQKLGKGEMQSELEMLEQAKKIALDHFGRTFKKLGEEVSNLSIQMANGQIVSSAEITKEDLDFAFQMLKQTKEAVEVTLFNTFNKLKGKLEKEAGPIAINTKSSVESRLPSERLKSSTKYAATLKQRKQEAIAIVKTFDEEVMKVDTAAETSEKKTAANKKQEETIKYVSETVSQYYFKDAVKVSESTKGIKKDVPSKTDFFSEKLEHRVSKVTLENIDELLINIREVFTFLKKDELLPETNVILKQVESKINEVFEKMFKSQLTSTYFE